MHTHMNANLEVFLFQSDDDPYFLRLDLHHVTPLELAQRIDSSRPVRTQLQIFRENLEVVRRGREGWRKREREGEGERGQTF